jgi:hypothetical protein
MRSPRSGRHTLVEVSSGEGDIPIPTLKETIREGIYKGIGFWLLVCFGVVALMLLVQLAEAVPSVPFIFLAGVFVGFVVCLRIRG